MKDTILPIRMAYYEALNGQLTSKGQNVPVYNDVPLDAKYPYVVLSTQDSVDTISTKACLNTEDYILIDIVTGFVQGGGGYDADFIANQVLNIVPSIQPSQLQSVKVSKVSDSTLSEKTESHKIFRRLIRFRHFIHHN
jgi:hypothetical protein